jgi:hypothetical protein
MKLTFAGDGNQTYMGHLQAIEDLRSLFKLTGIHHDDMKRKLLYLSLLGSARI